MRGMMGETLFAGTYLSVMNKVSILIFMFVTAGFIKKVPSVYTLLMNTIYQSHSTQVAEGTVFRKHTVPQKVMHR